MFESIGDTTTRTYTYEDNFFSLVVFTSVYLLAALAIAYTVESLFTEASYGQVWSLIQFYSLSFFFVKSVLPHNQGLLQLCMTVLWDFHSKLGYTWRRPCILVVPESVHEVRLRALEGVASATQKIRDFDK